MRWLGLYLRSRAVPVAILGTLGSTGGLWALSHAIDQAPARGVLALLAVAAGAAAMGPGLAGADLDLERTAAIAWVPRRAVHVLLAGTVVVGIVAATALTGDAIAATGPIARNGAGLAGLVALGAVTLGAARSWIPAVGWTLAVLPFGPPSAPTYQVLLTWMTQPPGTTTATVMAATLAVAGTGAYAVLGPRRG